MSYQQLRKDLIAKLGRTPQRLSQLVQDVKGVLPMSTREATCLLAHQQRLDIAKYLDQEELSQVRQLVAAFPHPSAVQSAPAATKARAAKPATSLQVTIGRDIKLSDPMLPKHVMDEAKLMAERVYPLLYVFENSVRHVIVQVMNSAAGPRWWTAAVSKDIAGTVAKRMSKEERNAWHGKRAADPIYYVDMDHLKQIITSNWQYFAPLFPDQAWFTSRFDAISMSRNVVDHHNPLAKDNIKALEVYTSEWHKQVTDCVTRGLLQRPGAGTP